MRRFIAKVSFKGSVDLVVVGCGCFWVVAVNNCFEVVMGGGGKIIAGCMWLWVVVAKLWLVVGGRQWWWQNYGWLWVVV